MLIEVAVLTRRGQTLTMPLADDSQGIRVEEIEGLDPVKATLVSTSFANMDGEQHHSSRREARDIKITLGLLPGVSAASVRDIRNYLYGFFMPKSVVTLRFTMSDGLKVDIVTHVEDFGGAMFTDEPKAVIDLRCFDPDFYVPEPVRISSSTTMSTNQTPIDYKGTVETGAQIVMPINRPINAFEIYHRPPDGVLRTMGFQAPMQAGDVLTITTVPGQKSVMVNRVGVGIISLLYGLSPQSPWLEIQPGLNDFQIYAEGAAIPYTIEYTTKYGGL